MSLFIGIPTYNGQIHHKTVAGLVQTAHMCAKKSIGMSIDIIPHDAFIGKARSLLVHRFLKTDFQELLFVDADIGFSVTDIVKVCKPDADIVMGLYRMKNPDMKLRYPALMHDPLVRNEKDESLIKLQYGPAGFMRVNRRVFEKMIEQWPDEWFTDDDHGKVYDLFPCGRFGNWFFGEDIAFCHRAKDAGFDIWAAQDVTLHHAGEYLWSGTWKIDHMVPDEAWTPEKKEAA
jgi:hypothetical protein